jgi:hypothetical protein
MRHAASHARNHASIVHILRVATTTTASSINRGMPVACIQGQQSPWGESVCRRAKADVCQDREIYFETDCCKGTAREGTRLGNLKEGLACGKQTTRNSTRYRTTQSRERTISTLAASTATDSSSLTGFQRPNADSQLYLSPQTSRRHWDPTRSMLWHVLSSLLCPSSEDQQHQSPQSSSIVHMYHERKEKD